MIVANGIVASVAKTYAFNMRCHHLMLCGRESGILYKRLQNKTARPIESTMYLIIEDNTNISGKSPTSPFTSSVMTNCEYKN